MDWDVRFRISWFRILPYLMSWLRMMVEDDALCFIHLLYSTVYVNLNLGQTLGKPTTSRRECSLMDLHGADDAIVGICPTVVRQQSR